ncbi:MAG TPA: septation protein A [Spirochaetota bacterium]|nr:septation protein A [Spirochaetota bacterium]
MKFFVELFPVILFFAAFKIKGIFFATAVAIAAGIVQIVYSLVRNGKVEKPMIVSLVLIIVFGGATLLLHDETFIKWKPTILYAFFSVSLVVSRKFFGKNLIRAMLNGKIEVPEEVWERLNYSWAGFFAVVAALNIFVARSFPTNMWVNFKLFGIMGLMFVFVIIQGVMLSRHIEDI